MVTAWTCCFVYCLTWFVEIDIDPHDEEIMMFVLIPTVILMLIAIEIIFLWRKMKYTN